MFGSDAALCKDVRQLIKIVTAQLERMDALIAHMTAIDADYLQLRDQTAMHLAELKLHNERIAKIERHLNLEPSNMVGDSSALYQQVPTQRM
jgi:hypothetical protein